MKRVSLLMADTSRCLVFPGLWIVYTCKFHVRFRIKLAHFSLKNIFLNKRASLMRNRARNSQM